MSKAKTFPGLNRKWNFWPLCSHPWVFCSTRLASPEWHKTLFWWGVHRPFCSLSHPSNPELWGKQRKSHSFYRANTGNCIGVYADAWDKTNLQRYITKQDRKCPQSRLHRRQITSWSSCKRQGTISITKKDCSIQHWKFMCIQRMS